MEKSFHDLLNNQYTIIFQEKYINDYKHREHPCRIANYAFGSIQSNQILLVILRSCRKKQAFYIGRSDSRRSD